MSKLINLFGGPGIGKSSIAAGITYKLKKKHISCNNPYEFPKLLAWDKNKEAIGDQLYVVANQHRGIAKSYGKVKYIIVDSPILLSLVYKNYYNNSDTYPAKLYGKEFDEMVLSIISFAAAIASSRACTLPTARRFVVLKEWAVMTSRVINTSRTMLTKIVTTPR